MPKVYIKTFGCQMNVYDSNVITGMLEDINYTRTNNIEHADLIIFNTCAVRHNAEHKALSGLGAVRKIKKKNPNLLVGIIGCVAQKLGSAIYDRYNFVDFILGTKDMYKLPGIIQNISGAPIIKTDLSYELKGYTSVNNDSVSANITIIRGCSNYCSYCIVPYVRGREESRLVKEVIDEARRLTETGVKEIILLGQNVNAFGIDSGEKIEDLLFRLNDIEPLERIRFVTSHPKSVTKKFIEAVRDIPKVCEHIHIPFQSGSNKILKQMNRKYTREEYIEKIKMIRSIIPEIAVTADVIAGYPGETEKDFESTLSLIKECGFDNLFSFKYSPRDGTKTADFPDDVPKKEKEQRLKFLHNVSESMAEKINRNLIGTFQEVLWEGERTFGGRRFLSGRTRTFKTVSAPYKENRIGSIDKVRITSASAHILRAY